MQKKMITAQEAADYLGLPLSTLATWRHRNSGPRYMKLGGRIFYEQADLDGFIVVVDPSDGNQVHGA